MGQFNKIKEKVKYVHLVLVKTKLSYHNLSNSETDVDYCVGFQEIRTKPGTTWKNLENYDQLCLLEVFYKTYLFITSLTILFNFSQFSINHYIFHVPSLNILLQQFRFLTLNFYIIFFFYRKLRKEKHKFHTKLLNILPQQ